MAGRRKPRALFLADGRFVTSATMAQLEDANEQHARERSELERRLRQAEADVCRLRRDLDDARAEAERAAKTAHALVGVMIAGGR